MRESPRLVPGGSFFRTAISQVRRAYSSRRGNRDECAAQTNIPFLSAIIDEPDRSAAVPIRRRGGAGRRGATVIGAKLVDLIEAHAGPMTSDVARDLLTNERTRGFRAVRHEDLEQRIFQILHHLGNWIGDPRSETVQAELLSPTAHVQAFVDRRALENLIRETREGKANRSYLLQVLLILELWQRENGVTAAG